MAKEKVEQLPEMNLEETLKSIEAQIAELRGMYNYIAGLKDQGFKVIPPLPKEGKK